MIDDNGYIGIGTTSPTNKLDIRESVNGTTDASNPGEANLLLLKNTGSQGNKSVSIALSGVNTDAKILAGNEISSSGEDGYLAFQTRKSEILNEVFRINSEGNVGIGTSSPSTPIDISGDDPDLRQNILSSSSANLVEHEFSVDNTVKSSLYYSKADDGFYLRNKTNGTLYLGTDNSNDLSIETGGDFTVSKLAGSGTRMVTADGNGKLASQTIPVNTDNQNLSFNASTGDLNITNGIGVNLSSLNGSPWNRSATNGSIYPANISDNIGIGTTNPSTALDIVGVLELSNVAPTDPGTDIVRLGDGGNNLQIQTNYGYTKIGPQNATWSHFYTDRPRYFFDKGLTVDGGLIGSYNEDLSIQTSGTTRMTIDNNNGYVGIGDVSPEAKLKIQDVETVPGVTSQISFEIESNNSSLSMGSNADWNWLRSSTGSSAPGSNKPLKLVADGVNIDHGYLNVGGTSASTTRYGCD